MLLGMTASVQADSLFTIRHMANEQNLVSLNVSEQYLLLPIQENAPESKIGIIKNNKQEGTYMNVRLARERVDYYSHCLYQLIRGSIFPLIYRACRNLHFAGKNLKCLIRST